MATVVIAEDDRDIRELVELILQEDGYTTVPVSDGLGALTACRETHPDVVLLDVSMPGELTGLEVCRRIRADEDLGGVRVMLLNHFHPGSGICLTHSAVPPPDRGVPRARMDRAWRAAKAQAPL